MDYKKAFAWGERLLTGAVVFILLLCVAGDGWLFWVSAGFSAACIISGIILKLKFYRCPYCKDGLPIRSAVPDYCPHCGDKLN